jgi:hypothetical protein
MNKIVFILFSLAVLSFFACEREYDAGTIASQSDARVIRVSIDVRDVPYDSQRDFYNHDTKVVTVQILPGMDWTTFTVFVTPTLYSTMTPFAGVEEDWSSGSKTYTITSGDGTVTNNYTVNIVEVAEFGNNNP